MGDPQVAAGVSAPPLAPQPFAVQQVRADEFGNGSGSLQVAASTTFRTAFVVRAQRVPRQAHPGARLPMPVARRGLGISWIRCLTRSP